MAENTTNYQCPACTGPLRFDSASGKLCCDYCGSTYDVAQVEALYGEKQAQADKAASSGPVWGEMETGDLSSRTCTSCGAELVCGPETAATTCPYCGNPTVLGGKLSGKLKPEYILPFKLDKKAAKAKLQEHLKGKTLLPRVFRSQNHIDEVKGVYVPFWLFDSDADAQLRFTATRTRSWSDSKYDYTETNYYSVRRDGTLGFDAVPVDGSSKIEDDLMESIEPFAMQDAIPFQTAYLAGYVADKYDVSAEDSI